MTTHSKHSLPLLTGDGKPTLDDKAVIDFCKNGFILLNGVVPDAINRKTLEFVDQYSGDLVLELLDESWFVDGVLLQPDVVGVVRSLLGRDFALPVIMSNHRVACPGPAQEWHTDGQSRWGPELDYLQVFYYPQECSLDMGPTEVLPGSHFLYANRDYMAHYGRIKGSIHTVAPSGSVFITVYSIWHRRSESYRKGIRNLLKYNYWRTEKPSRNWLIDPEFDVAQADFGINGPTFRQQFQDSVDAAEMYVWLRGEADKFRLMGGQGWPNPPHRDMTRQRMGVPDGLQ